MMRLCEAANAIGARLVGADVPFSSVSSDSRSIGAGALFVAISGERFDGHDFVGAVRGLGAAAALVSDAAKAGPAGLPLLVVHDTKIALGRLAAFWRRRFAIPALAIAGSNGKTTVTQMLASILRAHYGEAHVLATAGNLNNDIGLPLMALRLRDAHRVAALEIGMNHPGETAWLAAIAQPTIALVNNAQREHQEFMKSVAEVAREHAAALERLPADGIAVINADDDHAGYWRGIVGARRVRDFGIDRPAAVTARYRLLDFGAELAIETPEGHVAVTTSAAGLHNVRNALAAAATATAAGASLAAVASGLAAFQAVKGRLQRKRGLRGATLLDDTYNANPDSVIAAIDVLAGASGDKVLVLGDMGEVGERGPAFHDEVGRYAKARGVDFLLATGPAMRGAAHAFGTGAEHFEDVETLAARAETLLTACTTALVKGSRSMRMERVVARLEEKDRAACC
ncbi:MAG: UDP-N-acetylmuramoyl-tripeptide--D-alanyl-D-alanine ligase [Burkholderiales bacterium]|jgi:UDP-N-acetylmuramoyl-tripeptide--D-alanyl-D-alanine ligase|nr:UDP-N-acetylmuramoyl-tripeptide--D-alanyl-D-alanine ligase [Burkholderiales bacterium]